MIAAERGQASAAAVALLAVAGSIAVVLLLLVHVAVERARAQAAADGAALAAAGALLGRADATGAARAAAERYARRAGVEVSRVVVAGAAVEVVVRRYAIRVPVPALAGGGRADVAPEALARAALRGYVPAGADAVGADGLPTDVPPAYRAAIGAAAARERLPARLLVAQLRAESGFDPNVVSRAGARGIAQFMPGTWSGSWNPWRDASAFDPAAAIPAQARFMRLLLDEARGDVARALAFYNAGQGRAAGAPSTWPSETRTYVATVLGHAGLGTAPGLAMPGALPFGPPVPALVG